ncbi:MAG TPA: hypothetical protein VFS35_02585 [Terrimicrobiaceae bacterium]|nr:hypothetical protein [Terrimicrobiaceae bacterium]
MRAASLTRHGRFLAASLALTSMGRLKNAAWAAERALMVFPRLPTDNLWKFLSLFLLVVAIAFMYTGYSLQLGKNRERIERQMGYSRSWADVEHWEHELKGLETTKRALSSEVAWARRGLHEARLLADRQRWEHPLWREKDRIDGANERLWYNRAILTLWLAAAAFFLWWWKFQRHMDRLLKYQASSVAKGFSVDVGHSSHTTSRDAVDEGPKQPLPVPNIDGKKRPTRRHGAQRNRSLRT